MENGKTENDTVVLALRGHIDSSNAAQTEAELRGRLGSARHIVLDCEELAYISSAGLRMVLRFRKQDPQLRLINVASEVYDVFEMTGFTEMMTVEKAYRRFSLDGCEVLGEGSNGVVYRYDPEIVIKVYKNPDALEDIRRERELARKALVLGIPTAIPFDVVKVGDRYASVFELLKAQSFSKLIKREPEHMDQYIQMFVDLLKQIHSTQVDPADMPDMKAVALRWANDLQDALPTDQARKLKALIEAVPERCTMIHGDYHTNNVEMQNGEILLIDMDTLSYGHPVFGLASMYLAFVGFGETDPDNVYKFLGLPYDTAQEIWKKSLRLYLDTDDEAAVKTVEEKAAVVGYARLLRRTLRRSADTEQGQRQIALCRQRLAELLNRVDTLAF